MSSAFNIPAGFALVPVEPTQGMKRAANSAYQRDVMATAADLYRAMLSAAPTPPVDAVPGEPVAYSEMRCNRCNSFAGQVLRPGSDFFDCLECGSFTYKKGINPLAASVAPRAGSEPVAFRWRFLSGNDQTWRHAEKMPGFDPAIVESQPLCLTPIAPAAAAEPSESPWFGVEDEVSLTRAVSVMNDVLTDISGWEDRALAEAIESSKVDLCAMIECIRMRADDSYVPGSKPIDGEAVPIIPDRERAASLVASEGNLADRLDAMADAAASGSQAQSDLYAAATVWRKHLKGGV